MNPKIVTAIYGSAFAGSIILGIAYTLWTNKRDRKNPIKPPRLSDAENGERRIDSKFIKVIHSGLERS